MNKATITYNFGNENTPAEIRKKVNTFMTIVPKKARVTKLVYIFPDKEKPLYIMDLEKELKAGATGILIEYSEK